MPRLTNRPLAGLEALDYVVVVLYVLLTLASSIGRRGHQHNTDDFFLGNRRLPWMAVGLSIMATLLSSLTYLGLTGEVVKNGIAGFMTQACDPARRAPGDFSVHSVFHAAAVHQRL